MSICLFVGPTLRREEIAPICEAEILPPVAQGDVYRATRRGARAIGIIDGFFSGAPAVWHKEILWALAQGIHVFGSSSMGALRAAELHSFGMRGVGRIFEAFRDGVIEDDDEVAVVHGPAELGFIPVSEPMVNIRATLARAEAEGVLSDSSRRALETAGKALFYPHRTWPAILAEAAAQGFGKAEAETLQAWLPGGRFDQKRADALEMLQTIKETLAHPHSPRIDWRFEWTHFWDEMVATLGTKPIAGEPIAQGSVIEELRIEGDDSYEQVRARALLRLFAGIEARRRGVKATPEAVRVTLARIRAALGLFNRAELESWLARNDLGPAELERLVTDQTQVEAVVDVSGPSLDRHLLDELRLTRTYERFAERARHKRELLGALGVDDAESIASGPSSVALRSWFFSQRLRRPMPDDIREFVRALGFADLGDFDGAIRREWIYSKNQV